MQLYSRSYLSLSNCILNFAIIYPEKQDTVLKRHVFKRFDKTRKFPLLPLWHIKSHKVMIKMKHRLAFLCFTSSKMCDFVQIIPKFRNI